MQSFLAIFTAMEASRARSNWGALSESEVAQKRAAGVAAWNDWAERIKDAIVDPGSPIGKTKRADPAGVWSRPNTRGRGPERQLRARRGRRWPGARTTGIDRPCRSSQRRGVAGSRRNPIPVHVGPSN